jgi:DNA-binding NarL/FixJ family response regulator
VVVADDQTVVRDGLVTLLKLLPGIDVIAAASDGLEAVRLVGEHDPDVLLVDLRMPTMDGVEATRRVRADHPRTEVVVLTTYSDDDSVLSALRAGALGFLTKDADAESIGLCRRPLPANRSSTRTSSAGWSREPPNGLKPRFRGSRRARSKYCG